MSDSEQQASDDQRGLRSWFPSIEDREGARRAASQGLWAALAFMGMLCLGLALAYWGDADAASSTRSGTLVSYIVMLVIAGLLTWRISTRKAFISTSILLLWFLIEVSVKVVTLSTNFGWLIAYGCIIVLFMNGIRGAWAFRRADRGAKKNRDG